MIKNKELAQKIFHIIAGFTTIMKGVSKLDSLSKAIPLILIGSVFIYVAVNHEKLHHRFKRLDTYVFILEAIVMGIIAYSYISMGKTYLQYVYILVVPVYLFLAYKAYKRV